MFSLQSQSSRLQSDWIKSRSSLFCSISTCRKRRMTHGQSGCCPKAMSRGSSAVTALEDVLETDTRRPPTGQVLTLVWKVFLDFWYPHRLRLVNVRALHVSAWIKVPPGSKSTKRQHLSALRKLFAKLLVKGLVKENPAKEVRLERFEEDSSPTPIFDSGEIAKVLGSIRTDSLQGIRDKALFSVLLYSWCRVSALLSLRVED